MTTGEAMNPKRLEREIERRAGWIAAKSGIPGFLFKEIKEDVIEALRERHNKSMTMGAKVFDRTHPKWVKLEILSLRLPKRKK